ncbi:formate dehydrogenase N subunit beta transmembrane domain-containing protein, partial [Xenorhabdus bovienii]
AIGLAATFAASIFHYVGIGPNRVSREEEESALEDIDSGNSDCGETKK